MTEARGWSRLRQGYGGQALRLRSFGASGAWLFDPFGYAPFVPKVRDSGQAGSKGKAL